MRAKFLLGILLSLAAGCATPPQEGGSSSPASKSAVVAGLAAQIGCGSVFVSGRKPDEVQKYDITSFFKFLSNPKLVVYQDDPSSKAVEVASGDVKRRSI